MITPPSLQPGDTIGITCPSGYLPQERTLLARQTLEQWGYRVQIGATVGSENYYFSDTDERRLYDLQYMLDNPDIKAVVMGRGGYGLSRIIDQINFGRFKDNPKWICGFSDITVLHSHIQSTMGIATLHGPMCSAFKEEWSREPHLVYLKDVLSGQRPPYKVAAHQNNRKGQARGKLVGGNLAILAHLSGSRSQIDTGGNILFIEDIGEYLYNLDRMLLNLKRAGLLDNLSGLICGGFTDIMDTERPFGQNIYEIVLDKVREYHYPVCFDFPAGHIDVNYPLILGLEHELLIENQNVTLNYVHAGATQKHV